VLAVVLVFSQLTPFPPFFFKKKKKARFWLRPLPRCGTAGRIEEKEENAWPMTDMNKDFLQQLSQHTSLNYSLGLNMLASLMSFNLTTQGIDEQ